MTNCKTILSDALVKAEKDLDEQLAYLDRIANAARGLPEPGIMHPHDGLDDIVRQLRVQAQENVEVLVADPETRGIAVQTLRQMGYKITPP